MMKKLFNLVIGMMLLCSMGAFAKLIVECEPQSGTVVKGYSQTATQKVTVYATSNGEQVSTLSLLFKLPAGLAVEDGQTEGDTYSVTFTDAIIAANAIVGATVFDGELEIVIAPSIGASIAKLDVMNLPSGVRTALCDIVFTIDLDATTETTLTPQISVEKCTTYTDDVESVTDNLKLSFNLLRDTYSFAKKDGATVELDEDGAAVTIAATDTNLFTAQIWDVDKEALVDTDAVEFTAAVASDEAAGTVALEGGKFVYTPAENYNGNFTINYTATFTGIADANVDGSIDVTVNAVNDAPAIAIVEPVAVNEGEALTFAMSFSDVDTAWDAFTKTVTLNGNVIAGEWTAGETEGVYTFTASEIANYDIVAHPAKTATSALVVTIDDQAGDDGSVGTAEAEVTINDVDQATDFGATAIAAVAAPDPAVFGSKLTAAFTNAITDADGDEAEIAYQWYRDGAAVAGETALALDTAVKKGETWQIKATATVKPYGDEIAAQQEFASNEIVIGNTAPTTADAALFIRKTDGGEATAAADITMADVDGDDLEIVIKTQGTKGTAVVEGKTIKYTVTDTTTEFFDADADVVTFVVNDGTDDSAEATLTVTYRANPPAEITVTTPAPEAAIDEVDDSGDAVSFELAISATDSDEVTPNGIAKIEWIADEGLTIESTTTDGIDTAAATSTVVIKTNGYATLDGADRPANNEFTIKATVTDALGATTTETFKVTVNDVDRTAPATFTVALNPAEPKTQDDVTAAIDGAAEDPDGDAITGYKYFWTVNGAEIAEEGDVLAAANFKKGDTVAVKAAALTKPYGADEVENDIMEEAVSVVIGNTAPTLALVDDAKLEATEDQGAIEYALDGFVAAADPDAAEGVDTLAFEVTPNFGEEVGTLTYDAEAGNVTFTPAADFNTDGLDALPTFSVTVTDGEITTDPVNVEIAVAAVNDAPTATVADVYIQPDQAGKDVTVTFAVTAGPEDEAAQQIDLDSCDYTAPEDGKVLLDGYEAVIDNEAKTITFTFKVAENAVIGAEGKVKFAIKDDAGATSDEYSFKIVLSGTPWYPLIALPCEHDTEGVVVRMTVDGKQTDVVVKEKNDEGKFVLTPAAYYNSGFKGFDRNAQGDLTVYHWSAKGGTGELCADVEDGINVPDYQAPGKPSIEGTDNPNIVKVTAPLASGFVLTVKDENGDVVANVAQEFVPAGDGQMETSATVTVAGLESGKKYTVVACGVNPMGEYGEESDEAEVDLTNSEAEAWPGDGEFFPPQNWTTTIATNTTDITFKWPVNAKADNYTLRIYDGDGNEVSVHTKLVVNSITVTAIPAGSYRWVVETSNGEKSDMMLFSVVKNAGDDAVITGGVGAGDTLLLDAQNLTPGATYKYDVIYFDMKYNMWAYQLFIGTVDPDGTLIELTGDDVTLYEGANYIMIRPTAKGSYQTLLINDK